MRNKQFDNRLKTFVHVLASAAVLVAITSCAGINSAKDGDRNVLWQIVSNCLDPGNPDYDEVCKWPVARNKSACMKTTDVWTRSDDYVVIGDRKMCGCPGDFMHGLALPLQKVTGVEDKKHPAGIWDFAWDVAKKRIPEPEIALVANPPSCRSQDQLHIHLVRLNSKGHKIGEGASAARVEALNQVWNKAEELAEKAHLGYYGILVKRGETGFLVLVDGNCPEKTYTEYKCGSRR